MVTGESINAGRASGTLDEAALARRLAVLEAENHALRAEVERSRQVLESANGYAIVTLNLGGRITGWNAGARQILGYAEGEILGCSGAVFFTPEDRAEGVFVDELCRALHEGRAVNERWHLRRDGTRFWASGLMMPLVNAEGRPTGFLNIMCDGTTARAEKETRFDLTAIGG